MKKVFTLLLILGSLLSLTAQEPPLKTIEVVGYAEKEVTPDEIYYSVELADKREGKDVISLDLVDSQFNALLTQAGIAEDAVKVTDTDARQFQYRRKKDEVIRSRTYEIKFSNINDLDQFAERLSAIEIKRAGIVRVDHSELLQIEADLKIAAIKNAKERAGLLLKAIDEELGPVVEVSEIGDGSFRNYMEQAYYRLTRTLSRGDFARRAVAPEETIEFKPVLFTTTIRAKFAIQ
ncbi:MAG: SIMPL domain-containing protein [Saprospiraceae bacterium]|nr:SIMPL domain-containing protein [Lewinella sp.]